MKKGKKLRKKFEEKVPGDKDKGNRGSYGEKFRVDLEKRKNEA